MAAAERSPRRIEEERRQLREEVRELDRRIQRFRTEIELLEVQRQGATLALQELDK